jgi:putative phosphoribosyl transferase
MLEHTLVNLGDALAPAELCRVAASQGLIISVHPDGVARISRRLQSVLMRLQTRGFSTLDLDLLNADESNDTALVNDAEFLTRRLDQALDMLPAAVKHQPIGLFASESGAAAMLRSAVCRPRGIGALVSRSGRVDLAGDVIGDVRIPTLLVVASGDPELVEINRQAFGRLRCIKRIDVVPRATHHFLEAGTLDVVGQLAVDWFAEHLVPSSG